MTRKYTTALIDAADAEIVTWESIARACMHYMSEWDVEDMATTEFDGLFDEDDEEEEED